jgi:predicted kinase
MPRCIMLVGLPGVGKSTWLKDNLNILPPRTDTGHAPFIASSDFYINEAALLLGTTYSEIFPAIISFAERAYTNDIKTLAFNSYDFVIDRTNLSVLSRQKTMNLVRQYAGGFASKNEPYQHEDSYQFEAIVFKTPDERMHMDRLASRHGKYISPKELDAMKRNYTMPSNLEGFTNIRVIES